MSKSIDSLRYDHSIIRRLRNVAKAYSDLLYQGNYVKHEDIKELILTMEELIHKCHHIKEECSFFPTLSMASKLKEDINALVIEHEFGRRVLNMVNRYLDELIKDKNREPIARLLNAYVTFLDLHMEREERLFSIVEKEYIVDKLVEQDRFDLLSNELDKLKDKIVSLEINLSNYKI